MFILCTGIYSGSKLHKTGLLKNVIGVLLTIFSCLFESSVAIEILYEWSSIDFKYDPVQKELDLQTGVYKPEDVVIFDSDIYRGLNGTEVYVTTPLLIPGTPFSLSTITDEKSIGGPTLEPFPHAKWHNTGDCDNTIVSVWRIKIDHLGRLWAIDSGITNYYVNNEFICPPQLLIFDLMNKQLVRRFQIQSNVYGADFLLLNNIEVEILDTSGSDSFAYIANPSGSQLFIYNYAKDEIHSVRHPFFYPSPLYGFFNINNVKFTLMEGMSDFSLGLPDTTGNRTLFFHALCAGREGYVSTGVLRDPLLSQDFYQYGMYPGRRKFHTSSEVVDQNGMMIFANLEDNSLVAWDTHTPFHESNFKTVAKDTRILQFTTGMKILEGDYIIVTTSRLQNVIAENISRSEENYRILRGKIITLNVKTSDEQENLSAKKNKDSNQTDVFNILI